jgi:hypothetical protein
MIAIIFFFFYAILIDKNSYNDLFVMLLKSKLTRFPDFMNGISLAHYDYLKS